jgi:hypothetical protein
MSWQLQLALTFLSAASKLRIRLSSPPKPSYPCGNNLYLIVAPSGGRRWSFRWQRNGLVKKMGFGSARFA